MTRFKKFFIFILTIFLSFTLFGCGEDEENQNGNEVEEFTSLKVIAINDLHGRIEEEDQEYGMARIAKYVNDAREVEGQAVLLLSAGDTFQGTAISNFTYGLNVVKLMNEMKFDAMTIGNHEFDWGLDTVLEYVDGNESNGEATFPFIACNILNKETNKSPENLDPYQIVDYGDFSVGIIGYIGIGLEEDISASMVRDYYFADPVPFIAEYSKELRTEKGCDLVIAMGHDANSVTNIQLSELTGDEAIDAIINAHTHAAYTRSFTVGDRVIPYSQASTAGEMLTDITFNYDKEADKLTYGSIKNVTLNYMYDPDEKINNMVADMVAELAPIMDEELAIAGKYVSKSNVSQWIVNEMLEMTECDVAAINTGGVRAAAFPIQENTPITVKKVYEFYPFDNIIKTAEFTGQQLIQILKISDVVVSSNVTTVGSVYYIDGNPINVDQIYTFACVDYLFDREEIIYGVGQNIEMLSTLVRDVVIIGLRDLDAEGYRWLD